MKVIYSKTMTERIAEEITKAKLTRRSIQCILLSRDEWLAFCAEQGIMAINTSVMYGETLLTREEAASEESTEQSKGK